MSAFPSTKNGKPVLANLLTDGELPKNETSSEGRLNSNHAALRSGEKLPVFQPLNVRNSAPMRLVPNKGVENSKCLKLCMNKRGSGCKKSGANGKLSARAEQSRSEAKSAWPNVLSGAKKSTFTAPHVENMKPERDVPGSSNKTFTCAGLWGNIKSPKCIV